MSIEYTAIARGGIIIATYSNNNIDLSREIQKLLETPFVKNEQRRMNRFIFTFYKGNPLTFICATSIETEKQIPLIYLEILSSRWSSLVGDKSNLAGPHSLSLPYKNIFEITIKEATQPLSRTEKIKRDLDQTQRMVTDSVNLALNRNNELEKLNSKTEDLVATSDEFRIQANNMKNKMFCSWIKSMSLYGILFLLFIYIILTFFCGGYSLQNCFKKN